MQTIGTAEADGSPGGVTQIREVTAALIRVAKQRGMAVIIIGHVTKDGNIAGPRLLEHLVDVVLAFEGDRHSGFRLVRATKNRFGPADEVGCFEMGEDGIVEVSDPSGLFTSRHEEPVPGTCVTVTMEGRRPLLAELQALAGKSPLQVPRRTMHGVDSGRLAMVLAVLERRAGSGCTTPTCTSRPSAGPGSSTRRPIWRPPSRWPPAPWTSGSPSAASPSVRSAWPGSCAGCPAWSDGSPRPPVSASPRPSSRPTRASRSRSPMSRHGLLIHAVPTVGRRAGPPAASAGPRAVQPPSADEHHPDRATTQPAASA